MKCKYYLCMMLFSFMVLFHQYSLVKADETESTLTQKYFKLYADMTGKWDEKDGFIYRYSEKDNHAVIVAMNMDKKVITIPEKIDGKTVTEVRLSDVYGRLVEAPADLPEWPIPKVEVLKIPKTVKKVNADGGYLKEGYGSGMQSFLMNLKQFDVASGNKWLKSYKGIIYTKNGKKLISVPRKYTAKTVKVKKGTTKISDAAFSFCTNIKKVILPDTVKVIKQNAFECCSLNYIRMPRKLKELGVTAFRNSALKKITVYGKVELDETFKYCKKLKTVVLKKGVKELGELVFHECPKLRSVTVPKGIKNLGWNIDSIFYYRGLKCNLSNITIKTPKNSGMYKERKFLKKRYKIKVKVIK